MNYTTSKGYRDGRRNYRGGSSLVLVLPGKTAAARHTPVPAFNVKESALGTFSRLSRQTICK